MVGDFPEGFGKAFELLEWQGATLAGGSIEAAFEVRAGRWFRVARACG
jgi:hypothetical protein